MSCALRRNSVLFHTIALFGVIIRPNGTFDVCDTPPPNPTISMYLRLARRLLTETDKRLLLKAVWALGVKGLWSVHRHRRRLKRGEFFPPFLYMSVVNSCNLRCQGCWVDVAAKQHRIEVDAANDTIAQAKAMGNSFFGILGGEPFMHKDLLKILEANRDVYFQVFTNGHFITDEVAAELRRLGNVTPLISVEGSEIISDTRRGRDGVLSQTMQGHRSGVASESVGRRLHECLQFEHR